MSDRSRPVTYVLPLRWEREGPIGELAAYLGALPPQVTETIVVDGSPPPLFEDHAERLESVARHIRPHDDLRFKMGKVDGVLTGLRESANELIVLADDDVRYTPEALGRTVELLAGADLVRPQNYFDELPWHASWDTARTLLNRVWTGDAEFPVGDFPGTLAVRRASLPGQSYDGDVLFENLELMRTVRAAGGAVVTPLDLYVPRRPPSAGHFRSQRLRQAYDDFAIPVRIGSFLALGPLVIGLAARRRGAALVLLAGCFVAIAEIGRRRAGGAAHFPAAGSLLAPAWVAERSVCAWLALGVKLRGGVRYREGRISRSATSAAELRRRLGCSRP